MMSGTRSSRNTRGTTRRTGTGRPAAARDMPSLVDISTIAEHLDVSVRHVRRLVAERRIPYVKWGNLRRFDPVAVSEWLNCNAITPHEPGTTRRRDNG